MSSKVVHSVGQTKLWHLEPILGKIRQFHDSGSPMLISIEITAKCDMCKIKLKKGEKGKHN